MIVEIKLTVNREVANTISATILHYIENAYVRINACVFKLHGNDNAIVYENNIWEFL